MKTQRLVTARNEKGHITSYKYLVDGKEVPEGKKYCNACKTIKDITDFTKHGGSCKECANKKARELYARRKNNADWIKQRNQEASSKGQEAKKKAIALMGGKCVDCEGVFHPAVFDFHHVDPETKEGNVANLIRRKNWEAAEKELKKCVLLCANCHRLRHFQGEEN